MRKCNTCAHNAVCYQLALESKLGGKIKPFHCEHYTQALMPVDEDMALAFLAGAAAIENSRLSGGLFTVGDFDQRSIPFSDAARGLRRAGQQYLKLG